MNDEVYFCDDNDKNDDEFEVLSSQQVYEMMEQELNKVKNILNVSISPFRIIFV